MRADGLTLAAAADTLTPVQVAIIQRLDAAVLLAVVVGFVLVLMAGVVIIRAMRS